MMITFHIVIIGSVNVWWGHTICPSTGTQLVYSGRAGGSRYNDGGGGANPQCLPLDPNFYKTVSGTQHWAFMYGVEYEVTRSGSHIILMFLCCKLCSYQKYCIHVPPKYTCPSGNSTRLFNEWTLQPCSINIFLCWSQPCTSDWIIPQPWWIFILYSRMSVWITTISSLC